MPACERRPLSAPQPAPSQKFLVGHTFPRFFLAATELLASTDWLTACVAVAGTTLKMSAQTMSNAGNLTQER